MPTTRMIAVKDLTLDLHNFRTVHQQDELKSVIAMISINPDWFWALTKSLLEDGYHPTENIIVVEENGGNTVREGNRRIAALKLILGILPHDQVPMPADILGHIKYLGNNWKNENRRVPCAVYQPSEDATVDKIITLTHGKGERAGRDRWTAVAKARHNRDKSHASEPPLDLLEMYLSTATNLTADQGKRWAGDYPLTVLEEVMKRLVARLGAVSSRDLADKYPTAITHKLALDNIIRDIGLKTLGFRRVRDPHTDFAVSYGIPALSGGGSGPTASSAKGAAGQTTGTGSAAAGATADKSQPSNDPKSVIAKLQGFTPIGPNREKLVVLLNESRTLNLTRHPHAFCYLLRSMYEISAKAFCGDHAASGGPTCTKASGEDRSLVEVLRDITTYMTKNNTDKAMVKRLHAAMAELAKPQGFLSVTSMNQLVHHPSFTVDDSHISTLFNNIFPLLEEMNK